MTVDPLHEITVLLILTAGYSVLGAAIWLIFCSGNNAAVRKMNAALASRAGSVFTYAVVDCEPAGSTVQCTTPDLHATLVALIAEHRLSPKLAARLRRIQPVFHRGKWVVYPSNAYWAHRFERLDAG